MASVLVHPWKGTDDLPLCWNTIEQRPFILSQKPSHCISPAPGSTQSKQARLNSKSEVMGFWNCSEFFRIGLNTTRQEEKTFCLSTLYSKVAMDCTFVLWDSQMWLFHCRAKIKIQQFFCCILYNVLFFLLLVHVLHEPGKEILNRSLLLSQQYRNHKTTTLGGTFSYQVIHWELLPWKGCSRI